MAGLFGRLPAVLAQLHAAHTVIVVLAWFQALEEKFLPVRLGEAPRLQHQLAAFRLTLPLCDGGAERMDDVAVRVWNSRAASAGRGLLEGLAVGEQLVQVEGQGVQGAACAVGGLGPDQRQAHPPDAGPVGHEQVGRVVGGRGLAAQEYGQVALRAGEAARLFQGPGEVHVRGCGGGWRACGVIPVTGGWGGWGGRGEVGAAFADVEQAQAPPLSACGVHLVGALVCEGDGLDFLGCGGDRLLAALLKAPVGEQGRAQRRQVFGGTGGGGEFAGRVSAAAVFEVDEDFVMSGDHDDLAHEVARGVGGDGGHHPVPFLPRIHPAPPCLVSLSYSPSSLRAP
ncbi:NACHT N-terminal helical domain 7-containing protein [Streptomyces sp. MA5143a]|uniref:NACHT N-terminal helical domain 7-containing protein n=1 Tax=Streptomyces sp. MA5143a TaxID=2083010 RepID=UPI0035C070CD